MDTKLKAGIEKSNWGSMDEQEEPKIETKSEQEGEIDSGLVIESRMLCGTYAV